MFSKLVYSGLVDGSSCQTEVMAEFWGVVLAHVELWVLPCVGVVWPLFLYPASSPLKISPSLLSHLFYLALSLSSPSLWVLGPLGYFTSFLLRAPTHYSSRLYCTAPCGPPPFRTRYYSDIPTSLGRFFFSFPRKPALVAGCRCFYTHRMYK